MIKCLLSYETSHYVVYLKASTGAVSLSFDEARECLSSEYADLIESLSLDFARDKFEIFDPDFQQYVIVDRCTQIGHLCKLKVTKPTDQLTGQCANNRLNGSTGNSLTRNSPTGNCSTGNCSTGNFQTSNCPTSNCLTSNNCSTSNCLNGSTSKLSDRNGHSCELVKPLNQSQDLSRSNNERFLEKVNSSRELNGTKDASKDSKNTWKNTWKNTSREIGSRNTSRDTSKDTGRDTGSRNTSREINEISSQVSKESSQDNRLDRRKNSNGLIGSRETPIQPTRTVSQSASKESTPMNAPDRSKLPLMNSSNAGNSSNVGNSSNCSNTSTGDATVVFRTQPNGAKLSGPTAINSSNSNHSRAPTGHRHAQCQTLETERRIIHLRENPFQERCLKLRADYGRLVEENKRLHAKLELYKQGSVANATNYLDDFVSNADTIERLQKELVEVKEEHKTIMEAYKKKSNEFRRVVFLLTGFKFDALEQRKYRISHTYSNPNDYLFFALEKDEDISLLSNEFSEKFIDLINKYLETYDSYPSFLASITIKLFKEKQLESSKKAIG